MAEAELNDVMVARSVGGPAGRDVAKEEPPPAWRMFARSSTAELAAAAVMTSWTGSSPCRLLLMVTIATSAVDERLEAVRRLGLHEPSPECLRNTIQFGVSIS